jgi:hypothetical protein
MNIDKVDHTTESSISSPTRSRRGQWTVEEQQLGDFLTAEQHETFGVADSRRRMHCSSNRQDRMQRVCAF